MLLTKATPMASPPPPAPHPPPRCPGRIHAESTKNATNPTCKPVDHASGLPSEACSKNISVSGAMRVQRLSHDAYVGDAGLFHSVHHGSECTERYVLVGAQEHGLVLRIADLLPELRFDLIDVDGIITEKHALVLVDADHHALFGDFLDGARLWDVNFDPRLQHRSRDHKNDQQYKHHVN